MERERELREIREAIEAGLVTKNYLVLARESLILPAGFGIADMLGMDFIGGIGKHMKERRPRVSGAGPASGGEISGRTERCQPGA